MFRNYTIKQAQAILKLLDPRIRELEQEARTHINQFASSRHPSGGRDKKTVSEIKLDSCAISKEFWIQQLIQCEAIICTMRVTRNSIQDLAHLLILAKQRLEYFAAGAFFETLENTELPLLYSICLALITSMPQPVQLILDKIYIKQVEYPKHFESAIQGKTIFSYNLLNETAVLTNQLVHYLLRSLSSLEVDILQLKLKTLENRKQGEVSHHESGSNLRLTVSNKY